MSAIVARKRKVTATLQTGLEKTAAQLKVRVVRGDAEFVGAGLVRVASVGGSLEIAGDRFRCRFQGFLPFAHNSL